MGRSPSPGLIRSPVRQLPSEYPASLVAFHSITGFKKTITELDVAVRHWNHDGCNLDLRDAGAAIEPDIAGCRRRQVQDAPGDVRTAIVNGHDGGLAGFEVGHLGGGTQRESPACRIVAGRSHSRAVCHFSTRKHRGIDRRLAEALAAGAVELRPRLG